MNKADALRSKLEDTKYEAINDIRRILKNNGRQEHKLKQPIRVNDFVLKRIEHEPDKDPEEEIDLFVIADKEVEGMLYGDERIEMDDLNSDEVVHLLNDTERIYGPLFL